jgi:NADH-quinone oxidoreductase E subunit
MSTADAAVIEAGRPAIVSPLQLPGGDAPYEILDDAEVKRIQELRRRYPQGRSAILPALWILQRKEGILTAEGMREVASALELAPGPVEAVASFYSMYFFKPHGRYVVEVCTNLSCLLMGSSKVFESFQQQLGCHPGATTDDGVATLQEVECLGACGGAPVAQINHRFFENLTPEKVARVVEEMRADKLDLHALPTGREVAAHQELVDLANPGANRVPLPAGGAAGSVVDLVKGAETLIPGRDHPAERGYTEAPVEQRT